MKNATRASTALSPRLPQPTWKNPRLLGGILIVLLSVIGVIGLVKANDHTEPYLAATRDIRIGERVTRDDLRVVNVSLADSAREYLRQDSDIAAEAVATQPIFAGHIVPKNSLGAEDRLDRKPMSLTVDQDLASGIDVGHSVDVWVSEAREPGDRAASDPSLAVARAEVSRLTRDDSALGGSPTVAVQVLVAEKDLPKLIKAVSSESTITLVPTYRTGAE